MAVFLTFESKEKPTRFAWVIGFVERLAWRLHQEEIVIEATSPTHKAVMLESRQQRQQAVWARSVMTVANLNGPEFSVKQPQGSSLPEIDKAKRLVHD